MTKVKLEELEEELDRANGKYGELCLFCESNEYNSKEGIIHTEDCILKKIRGSINDEKKK